MKPAIAVAAVSIAWLAWKARWGKRWGDTDPPHLPALGPSGRERMWGPLPYTPTGEPGQIQVDSSWTDAHIVAAEIPELGRTIHMHRDAVGPFRAWLRDAIQEGLLDQGTRIDAGFYPRLARRGGVYHDAPSSHAYGTAWDLDPVAYPEGAPLDARITRLAKLAARHGIGWLGPAGDPAHFEVVKT